MANENAGDSLRDEEPVHRILVPSDADTRPLRGNNLALDHPKRLLEQRTGQTEPDAPFAQVRSAEGLWRCERGVREYFNSYSGPPRARRLGARRRIPSLTAR